jgi:membrane-associated protease RseP (regulator of RpoE activity)
VALAVLLAVALITGAAFGLSALVSGGSKPPSRQASVPTAGTPFGPQGTTPQSPQLTSPQQPTPQTGTQTGTTTTTPYTNNTIVDWLGMQIQTNAPGDVVIDTVRLGSSADAAAINPGEQLVSVNGHTLVSATDIAGAIKGLHHGEQVPIEISDGAATQVYYLPLGAPPSRHP